MKTPRTQSMQRSGTMPVQLPKIPKLDIKQSRYHHNSIINNTRLNTSKPNNNTEQTSNNNNNSNRSSFMRIQTSRSKHTHSFNLSKPAYTSRLQQQSISQQQYPYTQTTMIQKQQHRLKQLMKQFNEQTVVILQKYIIDKPIKREYIMKKPQPQQLQHIRQRQSQNSTTMILMMKKQIQKLQSRCEDLKYLSREQIEQKMRQLREERAKIVQQNKDLSREITLNGLQIVRGRQNIVKQLDYQCGLLTSKRDRLKQDKKRVQQEMQQLEQKTADINYQMEQLEQNQSYTLKLCQQKEKHHQKSKLYEEYQQKKRHYDHLKVMTQSSNYQLKHKYLQLLKIFDESGNEDMENKDYELSQKIESAIIYIQQLQAKCKQLMAGKFNNSKTSSVNNNNNNNNSSNHKDKNITTNNINNNKNKNDKNQYPNQNLFNTSPLQDQRS